MGAISRLLLKNKKIVQAFVVVVEGVENTGLERRGLEDGSLCDARLWKSPVEKWH
jgi:hypothetical protein